MRYLHKTPISYISQDGDRFIVSILRDDKVREYALMDEFGRISSKGYYNLSKRQFDDYFTAQPDPNTQIVINNNGQEIFKCSSRDEIHAFHEGIAVYEGYKSTRNYYLTEDGKLIGDEFKNVHGFANGLGVVELQNGKFAMVDKDMRVVTKEYEYLHPFFNKNYTAAKIDGKFVVIDREFNVVSEGIKNQSGDIEPYAFIAYIDEENVIHHYNPERKGNKPWSLVGINGNKLGDDHDFVGNFVEGAARVHDKEGTRYVDTNGNYIGKGYFINCSDFSEGLAVVGGFDENGEHIFAYMKKDGSFLELDSAYLQKHPEVSRVWFGYLCDFSEGVGSVIVKGKTRQVVGHDGKILKGKHMLGLFHDGFATYETSSGKWSYVSPKMEEFDREFDHAYHFENGRAVVADGKLYDVITTKQIMLSEISKFVELIEINPRNIENIPDKFYLDEKLITDLFAIALDSATVLEDADFLKKADKISARILAKIEEMKKTLI